MTNPYKINVLFVASEADPLIKVGGLGDVAGALPRSLRAASQPASLLEKELDARLVIPYHPAIQAEKYQPKLIAEYSVNTTGSEIPARAFALQVDDLPVYLVGGAPIEKESGVYSANLEEDGYKYIFFSMAALELARKLEWRPDILHANDWHTAASVYALALNRPFDLFYQHTASVLTIHNLPYLGAMTSTALSAFGMPPVEYSSLPRWAGHMALPLGLLTADRIVAVSPGYAQEIMTEEYGSGLHTFLKTQAHKVTGILNGLDTHRWDSASDRALITRFSVDNLSARPENKVCLQEELGLEKDPGMPLLAMVTRMDPQKGVDLAVEAVRSMLQPASGEAGRLQSIFLGMGNPVLEQLVRKLEQDYPGEVRARIIYDERLSRLIYGGADILLMPSRYEPCGLSQMIAMHYGCIPVARSTGGLSDTIHDPSSSDQSTGFLFKDAEPVALAEAIQRAINTYQNNPDEWKGMQIRGMEQDFSWDRSAEQYIQQYKMLLGSRIYV